jgi:hypothetical protein
MREVIKMPPKDLARVFEIIENSGVGYPDYPSIISGIISSEVVFDYPRVGKTILNLSYFSVFNLTRKYYTEFSNPNSKESLFIDFLLTSSNTEEYEIVKNAIYELFFVNYIDDMIKYLTERREPLSFSSLSTYLDFREINYINKMKENFINKTYKSNGNFFMFLSNNVFNDSTSSPLRKKESTDFNFEKYFIVPEIDYMDIRRAYRSVREAEIDYWNIAKNYAISLGFSFTDSNEFGMNFTSSFVTNISRDLIATMFNKLYRSINGTPIFMRNSLFKSEFSSSNSQNNFIKDILLEDFSLLSEDFFNEQLEIMFREVAKYAKENNFIWDEGNMLENFLNSRLTLLNQKDIDKYTLNDLKTLKFYRVTLAKFLGISSAVFEKDDQLTLEFENLRTLVANTRDVLKQKGKFK